MGLSLSTEQESENSNEMINGKSRVRGTNSKKQTSFDKTMWTLCPVYHKMTLYCATEKVYFCILGNPESKFDHCTWDVQNLDKNALGKRDKEIEISVKLDSLGSNPSKNRKTGKIKSDLWYPSLEQPLPLLKISKMSKMQNIPVKWDEVKGDEELDEEYDTCDDFDKEKIEKEIQKKKELVNKFVYFQKITEN